MKEVIRSIIRMNEQGHLTICGIDTLIRIDEGLGLNMYSNCAFKDTIACLPKIRTLIGYESVLV